MSSETLTLSCRVNGLAYEATVPARLLLSDFLRHSLGLTGTHVGCEHGVCGACTVIVDGAAVRSCLMFAVQVDGSEVRTVEGLAPPDGPLDALQQAFRDEHGLQCGFCTPGILMSLTALAEAPPGRDGAGDGEGRGDRAGRGTAEDPGDGNRLAGQIATAIGGHLCRCTGYRGIELAARRALGVPAGGVAAEVERG